MDFTIKTKVLADALSLVNATTDRSGTTIPVLSMCFLEVADGRLTVRATDIDRVITSVIECEVKAAGKASVNFARLQSTVNLLTGEDSRIKVNKSHRLEITCGKSTSRIPIEDVGSIPDIDPVDGSRIEMSAASFANALRQVMSSVNEKDEGVIELSVRPGVLRIIAMNLLQGHRVAITEVACPSELEFKVSVGYGSSQAVRKMLSGADGHATLQEGSNGVSVACGGNVLFFRKSDKRLPDVMRAVTKRDKSFAVPTKEFLACLKRTMGFAIAGSKETPTVDFGCRDGDLELTYAADVGESQELLTSDLHGDKPNFRVNGGYVLAFVNDMWSKDVEFRYGGAKESIWIKPADAEYPLLVLAPILK